MISLEMKYTALYWALNFEEISEDIFVKYYNNDYKITIFAENQLIDYGKDIIIKNKNSCEIISHRDLVILECLNRLLDKGINPNEIVINAKIDNEPDIICKDMAIFCEAWQEYSDDFHYNKYKYNIKYTSLLVSGIVEIKNIIIFENKLYDYGIFEYNSNIFYPKLKNKNNIIDFQYNSDFILSHDELIKYKGKSKKLILPEGIRILSANSFWNNKDLEEVVLPESLEIIGGDSFYYCEKLKKINIPKNVLIIGNNPFSACKSLEVIENKSEHFIIKDNILFNKKMDRIIYYPMNKKDNFYSIPDTVKIIGKHSFYNNKYIEKLIIPKSVIHMENNPFSDCDKISLDIRTNNYHNDNGVVFNKFKTMIVCVLKNANIGDYTIPDTVKYIGRNSFWNCKSIKKLTISNGIVKIGYNPFANCDNIELASKNPKFIVADGMLLNSEKNELICCPNRVAKGIRYLPKNIKRINSRAFSGCFNLKSIELHNELELIDKSAFTLCSNLKEIYIPDSCIYVNEWAFAGCVKLKKISINENTNLHKNAFIGCDAKIIKRRRL